ncbi:HNH endonuclease signature motif containing protein [Tenacibaculum sp. 190524A02b]|uniref:HNH endonuclease signature motif containing protein n=1 Tax=Tenacibaculum vairaonense TaxID=3137860 RepID=UPI0031FB0DEF
MPKGYYIQFTKEQEQKIKDQYLLKPVKRLADELGTTYGRIMRFLKKNDLEIPRELIEKRIKDSRKKKGDVPFNKGLKQEDYMTLESIEKTKATRFKKGNIPHNTNYDGHERITKEGYVEIRVSKGIYKLKHVINWERINGKIPEGHCLLCLDKNRENTNPENWRLVSRMENMYRNSVQNYPKEIIPSLVLNKQIENKLNSLQDG